MLDPGNGINIAAGCLQLFPKILKILICAGLRILHLKQLIPFSFERFKGGNLTGKMFFDIADSGIVER